MNHVDAVQSYSRCSEQQSVIVVCVCVSGGNVFCTLAHVCVCLCIHVRPTFSHSDRFLFFQKTEEGFAATLLPKSDEYVLLFKKKKIK